MTRTDLFWTLAALTAICVASWAINTFAWFAWVIVAAALLFVLVGSFVLAATSQRRVVSRPRPDPWSGSHSSLGGRGHVRPSHGRRTRVADADRTPTRPGHPSQGLGGFWW